MSIKLRLLGICIFLVTVPVLVISILGYISMKKELYQQVEESITLQSIMTTENIRSQYENVQNKVNEDLKLARYIFDEAGTVSLDKEDKIPFKATNQITTKESNITIPSMKINGKKVANNFEIVDKVKGMVGGTCTIFQVIDEGLLRISTNVEKEDGKRAVGTYIPTDSEVYQTIMKGDTYRGRAFVVTEWYLTAYEPIKDSGGNTIGVLYVGVKEKPYQERILDRLSKITIGKTGYIWIINSGQDEPEKRGEYVLSSKRERDGENIWDVKDAEGNLIIHKLVEEGEKQEPGQSVTIPYPWINEALKEKTPRMKFATVTYVKEWNWVIGPSVYYDEFLDGLYELRQFTIILAIISIIVGSIIAFIFATSISRPFEKMVAVFGKVASGDLRETVEINTNITELKHLSESCNRMINSIKNTINVMNKFIGSLTESSSTLGDIAKDIQDKSVADKIISRAEDMKKMSGRLDSLVKEYEL